MSLFGLRTINKYNLILREPGLLEISNLSTGFIKFEVIFLVNLKKFFGESYLLSRPWMCIA